MGAKDAVLKASRVLEMTYDWDTDGGYKEESVDNLLLEQAEISFKTGIKEVVEWINKNRSEFAYSYIDSKVLTFTLQCSKELWEAKLKEWGV